MGAEITVLVDEQVECSVGEDSNEPYLRINVIDSDGEASVSVDALLEAIRILGLT